MCFFLLLPGFIAVGMQLHHNEFFCFLEHIFFIVVLLRFFFCSRTNFSQSYNFLSFAYLFFSDHQNFCMTMVWMGKFDAITNIKFPENKVTVLKQKKNWKKVKWICQILHWFLSVLTTTIYHRNKVFNQNMSVWLVCVCVFLWLCFSMW